MTKVEFLPATLEHAGLLAASMRAEDVAEVVDSGAGTPLEAVERGVRESDLAFTLLLDGEVAAMFGVSVVAPSALTGDTGALWLLTGEAVSRHRKTFVKSMQPMLDVLLNHCSTLTNYVDERYVGALRFIEWLGGTFGRAVLGPTGVRFRPFIFRRSPWAQ